MSTTHLLATTPNGESASDCYAHMNAKKTSTATAIDVSSFKDLIKITYQQQC